MKILVTGGNGLVGSHFVENFNNTDLLLNPSREDLDITDKKSVEEYIDANRPDAIIHFAAFTDVTKAESERNNQNGQCWIINVNGTKNLIESSKNAYFIHISTDTVFSGHKDNPGPYKENYPQEDNSELVSWYGWTKKVAEKLVLEDPSNKVVLRISNPTRANFTDKLDYARKILNLYDNGKIYPMFNDQFLTLTFIDEVTASIKLLLSQKKIGIFHTSSTNLFTPWKLANYLIEKARGEKNAVKPVSITEFLKDNPSRYPQYGGLQVEKTMKELNIQFNTWEETINSLVKQLSA